MKTGEYRIMVSTITDPDPDAWIEAGVIVAETAIGAQERYLRDLEATGCSRETFRIQTIEFGD